jgi:hypothetical protein
MPLYWLRLQAGDKRTRTADIRHRVSHHLSGLSDRFYHRGQRETITPPRTQLTTLIVLCSPKSNFCQKALVELESNFRNSRSSELSSYRRTQNSSSFSPDSLVLTMSCCPSPTLSQPKWTASSTSWIRFYGRSVTPGCLRHPRGDLVVPTGWRRWGRSMACFSCHIVLEGLKRDNAPSCSQGPTWSSSPGILDEVTLGEPPTPTIAHVRSIPDLTNYPSYLLYAFDSPSLSQ